MNFFVENAWMIPALALWAFLLIVFGINLNVYENKKISSGLVIGATAIGLIFSAFILGWSIQDPTGTFERNSLWLSAGNIRFSAGWLVDNLSAMMLMVVTSVSLLIQIYSHEYMNKDEGYHRFFAYLALFNFSMLGLVLSTNLFQIYIFWELVGLSSYLLIGFWFKRPSAADAAKKAFIMNRIGDFGLLAGIMGFLYYSLNWWGGSDKPFLSFSVLAPAAKHVFEMAGPAVFALIAFGIFLGAVAKSAQFPLHTWLPDAMEGPTPISALIHAATMVAAGVYLIARAYPIFELSPQIMTLMAWTGAFTALLTALIAVSQYDIKRVLAYSTCSQLGFMVMAMGVGAYSAGLFHLFTHAYFKAMLFLCSGAVIHGLADQQDMRYMGGLRKKMPAVAYTYLIGCFAISGILLSGFWSKDEIFAGIYRSGNMPLLILGVLIAGMTSFYMFRSYFMAFEGEYRGNAEPHNANRIITMPLIVFAVPSAIIGFMLSGKLAGIGIESFNSFIEPIRLSPEANESWLIPVISLFVALLGAVFAAVIYWDKIKTPAIFERKQCIFCKKPCFFCAYFKTFFYKKAYFDEIYGWFIRNIILGLANFCALFDKYIIDGFVNTTAFFARLKSRILGFIQNGNVESYAAMIFGGMVGLMIIIVSIQFFVLRQ